MFILLYLILILSIQTTRNIRSTQNSIKLKMGKKRDDKS